MDCWRRCCRTKTEAPNVIVTAQTGAAVAMPMITSSHFAGPVTMTFGTEYDGVRRVTESASDSPQSYDAIKKKMSEDNKRALRERFERLFEGTEDRDNRRYLREIYTELYMTEGVSEEVNTQHEVRQIEIKSRRERRAETPINCNNIFHPSPGQACVRTVMTQGIAGIGKTVSVQKFILDWAEGRDNQDVDFIIVLPFRELNLVHDVQYSLLNLLLDFHPELRTEVEANFYHKSQVIFVLDGLDECKLPLNFEENRNLSDITETTSVDMLLTNLIKKKLLPCALKWITSRPAAANRVPPDYIDKWTEVRGFTDLQKEKYFTNRIKGHTEANRVVSQIKNSRSLYIMCHIPVFCWILATVFVKIGKGNNKLPQTLTEVFIHFVIIQANRKNTKYDRKKELKLLQSNKHIILKLSKLAFTQLEKGNILFTEEDLEESEIIVSEDLEKAGMCTEIFVEEPVIQKRKLFCFVHLSIQEFLAALHVFQSFLSKDMEALTSFPCHEETLHGLLKAATDKSLQSLNGHLDLFLRFLMGISLESNQKLLKDLLPYTVVDSETLQNTVRHIRDIMGKEGYSKERCMNLLLCLLEVKDKSLHEDIKKYLKPGSYITEEACSTLAYVCLMSDVIQDVFDLRKYNTSIRGRHRLVIVIRSCRKALFAGCGLTLRSCEDIASALQAEDSPVQELDLSSNPILDEGVQALCAGLAHRNCQLKTLRLAGCGLTTGSCKHLASVLQSETSQLRELDLSSNDLDVYGIQLLSCALVHTNCKLEVLRLAFCNLRGGSCKSLASALQLEHSQLRELDLSNNDLTDEGARELSTGLGQHTCTLNRLRLSGCLITKEGCTFLSQALKSNPSHLEELDLSYNHPGDSGVRTLTALLTLNQCKLTKLKTDPDALVWLESGLQKYMCEPTLDPSTAHRRLILSEGRNVTFDFEEYHRNDTPDPSEGRCYDLLCRDALIGRHYWEVEWSGVGVSIGVAYRSIIREGNVFECELGANDKSWCLETFKYYDNHVSHNDVAFDIPAAPCDFPKVGVYLDWPAGTLSFYSISSVGTRTHWYTLQTTFTEPLYPAFGFTFMEFRYYDFCVSSSVTICRGSSHTDPLLSIGPVSEREEPHTDHLHCIAVSEREDSYHY